MNKVLAGLSALSLVLTMGCEPLAYTVGGVITGLTGTLVLTNNGIDPYTATVDGPFEFGARLQDSESFLVEVANQPAGQYCTVTNASGSIDGEDMFNVFVTCTDVSNVCPYAGSYEFDNPSDDPMVPVSFVIGDLGPCQGSATDGAGYTNSFAVNPDGRFAYAFDTTGQDFDIGFVEETGIINPDGSVSLEICATISPDNDPLCLSSSGQEGGLP